MHVNPTLNAYTVSLFQGANTAGATGQAVTPAGPAAYFAPGVRTDMPGVYADPRIAPAAPAALSASTQRILDKINALISNELKTISTTYRELAEADIGRELPERPKYSDFSTAERMGLSKKTRNAERLAMSFSLHAGLATMDPSKIKGRSIMIGEQYLEMTQNEIVERTIHGLVNAQVQAAQQVIEMSKRDDFMKLSQGTQNPTGPLDAMTPDEVETMRRDLLAKWTEAYERGEIDLKVEIFASGHAVNYDRAHQTLDMATGEYTVIAENAVAFDEAWEFSEARKATMSQVFTGIGGGQFLDGLVEYAEEYLKDLAA